jgi:hypothetical protein
MSAMAHVTVNDGPAFTQAGRRTPFLLRRHTSSAAVDPRLLDANLADVVTHLLTRRLLGERHAAADQH